MVVKAAPSAATLPLGLTVTVESDSFTGPGTKITVALGVIVVVPTRAVTVLVSARAEERRAVVWPFVSVGAGLGRGLARGGASHGGGGGCARGFALGGVGGPG